MLIIINNAAARARRAWAPVKALLEGGGVSFDVHETRHAGDATEQARVALKSGYRTIAVIGGDGTLSEAAAGFFDEAIEGDESFAAPSPISKDAVLAPLPAGTGDDFARGLTAGRENVERWAHRLVAYYHGDDEERTRLVDVICGWAQQGERARRFVCLNAATIGIGAEVASRVLMQRGLVRRLPGEARFVQAALGALAGWRERPITVSIDGDGLGRLIESTSNLIAVANGTYAGGGMMFAPGARLDDGKFDVVLATGGLTRRMILRELPRIRRGAHLSNPKVRVIRATRLHVATPGDSLLVEADGNVRGHTPATFRIIPRSLRVLA